MATFQSKEVPTGVVDGVNKSFILSQNASAIDDVFVDGAVYLGAISFTAGGSVFSLADAPTVDIFVDYFINDGAGSSSAGNTSLSSLLSKLRRELRMDKDDKIWNTDEKTDFLNEAYLQVQKDGNYNWQASQGIETQALTAGTQEYSLPTDFIRYDYIQLVDNNEPLRQTTKQNVLRRGTSSNGRPNEYYIYGGNIGLYPTPDSNYSLQFLYRKRLPTLTDAQGSELPEDFDRAIIKYAAYLAWSSPRGNTPDANAKLQDYEQAIDRLFVQYTLQSTQDLRFTYQTNQPSYWSDKALND